MTSPTNHTGASPLRDAWRNVLIVLAVAGMALHSWAGWVDEKQLVWQPVGPLSAYALFLWIGIAIAAFATVVSTKPRSMRAIVVTVVALIGILLLLVR